MTIDTKRRKVFTNKPHIFREPNSWCVRTAHYNAWTMHGIARIADRNDAACAFTLKLSKAKKESK